MADHEPVTTMNFYDLVLLLARWRKAFIFNVLVAMVISSVIVLVVPKWYKAQTVILPPAGGGGALPSFLSKDLAGVATSFGLDMPTEEIYQTVLGSRTLKQKLIDRFELRKVYKVQGDAAPELVMKALEKHYTVLTRDDGAIEITVEDQSPERAAAMANGAVDELDYVYRSITSNTARNNRLFVKKRIDEINDSLKTLQDSLLLFQETYRAVSLSDQISAMIDAAAQLKGQQMATDIQRDVMKLSLGDHHPAVENLSATSKALGQRYEDVLTGKQGELFLNLTELPTISRHYAELLRAIRIQNTVLEFIYPQYENARIQEGRETANVQILDRAVVPIRKSKPPRTIIVLITGVVAGTLTLLGILTLEYWRKIPVAHQGDWEKIQKIRDLFKRSR